MRTTTANRCAIVLSSKTTWRPAPFTKARKEGRQSKMSSTNKYIKMLSSALLKRFELIILLNRSPNSVKTLRISKMNFIWINHMYHHLTDKFKSDMVMVRIIACIIDVVKGLTGQKIPRTHK